MYSKKTKFIWAIIGVLSLPILSTTAYAVEMPRALSTDARIKVVPYQENNVVPVYATTFITTQIILGEDESIVEITGGDSSAWEMNVSPLKNVINLKPTIYNSNTDLLVTAMDTGGQRYYYRFHLMSNKNAHDNPLNQTYAIEFIYPEKERQLFLAKQDFEKLQKSAIANAAKNPKAYNWDYSFNGSTSIMPLHVFDDGQFTYFQLIPNHNIPAIFAVDNAEGEESVVNYRRVGDYLVVEEIAPQFTLRDGKHLVASIFNNRLISKIQGE